MHRARGGRGAARGTPAPTVNPLHTAAAGTDVAVAAPGAFTVRSSARGRGRGRGGRGRSDWLRRSIQRERAEEAAKAQGAVGGASSVADSASRTQTVAAPPLPPPSVTGGPAAGLAQRPSRVSVLRRHRQSPRESSGLSTVAEHGPPPTAYAPAAHAPRHAAVGGKDAAVASAPTAYAPAAHASRRYAVRRKDGAVASAQGVDPWAPTSARGQAPARKGTEAKAPDAYAYAPTVAAPQSHRRAFGASGKGYPMKQGPVVGRSGVKAPSAVVVGGAGAGGQVRGATASARGKGPASTSLFATAAHGGVSPHTRTVQFGGQTIPYKRLENWHLTEITGHDGVTRPHLIDGMTTQGEVLAISRNDLGNGRTLIMVQTRESGRLSMNHLVLTDASLAKLAKYPDPDPMLKRHGVTQGALAASALRALWGGGGRP